MKKILPIDPIFIQRRRQLALHLKRNGGGIAILPTSLEVLRNRDNEYAFRADSYFYYLSGFDEPQSWLIIDDRGQTNLFCRTKDKEKEVWTGYRLGPQAAPRTLQVDFAYPVDKLDEIMPELLANQPAIWFPFATHEGLETQIATWLEDVRSQVHRGIHCPSIQHDLCVPLDEMRLTKSCYEIKKLRTAGRISALGHIRAMQTCAAMIHAQQDIREYHLDAELLYTFRRHGAQDVSFNSIVAAGANACVLHYRAGNAPIRDGELVLIDAGCEFDYYAGDISRTFPANGRFTSSQQALYELVLAMQQAAIKATKPGARFKAPHEAAVHVLSQGLLDLKLLSKKQFASVDDVIEKAAYRRFYMHNTSHWLGMDVHDCGSYIEPGRKTKNASHPASRILQPGMVLTLEPGIYVSAAKDIPAQFHNIGIRIEDDALVTSKGCELLTRDVPVEVQEIEKLMAQ